MNEAKSTVYLYVYDLSGGLAATISENLLGKKIDGIWHTSIVVDDKEYYFGAGISIAQAGKTHFGQPVQIIELGVTGLRHEEIADLVVDLKQRFSQETYSLLSNNCNNFTNEMASFLVGRGIPEHIVKLPDEVMSTVFGETIRPMLAGMEAHLGSVSEQPAPPPPPQPNLPVVRKKGDDSKKRMDDP